MSVRWWKCWCLRCIVTWTQWQLLFDCVLFLMQLNVWNILSNLNNTLFFLTINIQVLWNSSRFQINVITVLMWHKTLFHKTHYVYLHTFVRCKHTQDAVIHLFLILSPCCIYGASVAEGRPKPETHVIYTHTIFLLSSYTTSPISFHHSLPPYPFSLLLWTATLKRSWIPQTHSKLVY